MTSSNTPALRHVVEVLRRLEVFRPPAGGAVLADLDRDHPVRLLVGERVQQDVVDDAEDGGDGADAERQEPERPEQRRLAAYASPRRP